MRGCYDMGECEYEGSEWINVSYQWGYDYATQASVKGLLHRVESILE